MRKWKGENFMAQCYPELYYTWACYNISVWRQKSFFLSSSGGVKTTEAFLKANARLKTKSYCASSSSLILKSLLFCLFYLYICFLQKIELCFIHVKPHIQKMYSGLTHKLLPVVSWGRQWNRWVFFIFLEYSACCPIQNTTESAHHWVLQGFN